MRFPLLLQLLRRNDISLHPKKLLRALFLLQGSLWSSLFAFVEKKRISGIIKEYNPPADPVFIIGHWRTGSTLLHQLLACDPQFAAPTLFQVALPESFLTTRKYFRIPFSLFIGKHRPMDNVSLGMDEPQEDEYAIFRMTCHSPLELLIFPGTRGYFLDQVKEYIPSGDEMTNWEEKLRYFFKCVAYSKNGRVISKNPFHSFRIPALIKMFPNARFIHIIRDPVETVPSTIHMWNIVQRQNCLTDFEHKPEIDEVCKYISLIDNEINEKKQLIGEGNFALIRYEDLEKNPKEEISKLYLSLGLEMSSEFEQNVQNFLKEHIHFQKNTYTLSDDQRKRIRFNLTDYLTNYAYTVPDPNTSSL